MIDLEDLRQAFIAAQMTRLPDLGRSSIEEYLEEDADEWAEALHGGRFSLPLDALRLRCAHAAAIYVTARDKGLDAAILLKLSLT